jgi:hypothetical protein
VEASVIEEDLPYVEVGQPVDLFSTPCREEIWRHCASSQAPAGIVPVFHLHHLDHVPEKLIAE